MYKEYKYFKDLNNRNFHLSIFGCFFPNPRSRKSQNILLQIAECLILKQYDSNWVKITNYLSKLCSILQTASTMCVSSKSSTLLRQISWYTSGSSWSLGGKEFPLSCVSNDTWSILTLSWPADSMCVRNVSQPSPNQLIHPRLQLITWREDVLT